MEIAMQIFRDKPVLVAAAVVLLSAALGSLFYKFAFSKRKNASVLSDASSSVASPPQTEDSDNTDRRHPPSQSSSQPLDSRATHAFSSTGSLPAASSSETVASTVLSVPNASVVDSSPVKTDAKPTNSLQVPLHSQIPVSSPATSNADHRVSSQPHNTPQKATNVSPAPHNTSPLPVKNSIVSPVPAAQKLKTPTSAVLAPVVRLTGKELLRKQLTSAVCLQRWMKVWREKKQARALAKKLNDRNYVAMEILSTERKYVTDLISLKNLFIDPLKPEGGKPIMSDADSRAIFSVIPEIIGINGRLLEDLEARMKNWHFYGKLGDVFLLNAPLLKVYMMYCSNYQQGLATLARFRTASSPFNAIVEAGQANPRSNNWSINAFLITPVQRIPRYQILLQELFKNTPVDHPDYADTEKALVEIRKVAGMVNDAIRSFEKQVKVMEVQQRLSGKFEPLVQPWRTWIREGELKQRREGGKSPKIRVFFLFNDTLLIANKKTVSMFGHDCEYRVLIDMKQVTSVLTHEFVGLENGFIVRGSFGIDIILSAETAQLREQWVTDLRAVVEGTKKHIQSASTSFRSRGSA